MQYLFSFQLNWHIPFLSFSELTTQHTQYHPSLNEWYEGREAYRGNGGKTVCSGAGTGYRTNVPRLMAIHWICHHKISWSFNQQTWWEHLQCPGYFLGIAVASICQESSFCLCSSLLIHNISLNSYRLEMDCFLFRLEDWLASLAPWLREDLKQTLIPTLPSWLELIQVALILAVAHRNCLTYFSPNAGLYTLLKFSWFESPKFELPSSFFYENNIHLESFNLR